MKQAILTKFICLDKKKYTIQDWAGNVLFEGRHWNDFEDANDFLCEFLNDKYETDREEYYILPCSIRNANCLDPKDSRHKRKATV